MNSNMSHTPGHDRNPSSASYAETFVARSPIRDSNGTAIGSYVEEKVAQEPRATPKYPPVIPPPSNDHSGRTLIVCFDGTGDQFDNDNSNVVKFLSLLKKDNRSKQLVYYQSGIGTYTSPEIVTPIRAAVWKKIDAGFAWNLDKHIMSGYEFLMQSYISGDKICIFGGALANSCLASSHSKPSQGSPVALILQDAGMLHKVGLLPAGNFQQVPFAYQMYTQDDCVGWEQSNEFKKAYCIDVPIEFLGVWDTVDSVGIFSKRLPFTTANTIVKTFRHAISLDERRAKFKANLWNRPTQKEMDDMKGVSGHLPQNTPKHAPTTDAKVDPKSFLKEKFRKRTEEDEEYKELNALERVHSEKREKPTDVEEVWFSGCHCDIGGGSVSNKTRFSLARIPLRWMVRECFKAKTGILFNSVLLYDIGMCPSTLYPNVLERPTSLPIDDTCLIESPPAKPIPIRLRSSSVKLQGWKKKLYGMLGKEVKAPDPAPDHIPFLGEEEEELHDTLSPIYDQLKIAKAWWVLEYIPLPLRYQRGSDECVSHIRQNKGAPRIILMEEGKEFKVHRTVKMRMEAQYEDEERRRKGKRYIPRPTFPVSPLYVS
ncbi:hypothetical protein D9619_001336 [Psilocybe cf. subviscida]|uniref:T6SS Phospholipase effector Tle1-like catalytic domain-containing protein n=1 Tax=Psilocybe cf. subviscida TaxID=2480587 RepID=A0A8H5BDQ3_9AGAR|nr:hypothetical protein D9619_001336 [Psilocybe cf. subviscida]